MSNKCFIYTWTDIQTDETPHDFPTISRSASRPQSQSWMLLRRYQRFTWRKFVYSFGILNPVTRTTRSPLASLVVIPGFCFSVTTDRDEQMTADDCDDLTEMCCRFNDKFGFVTVHTVPKLIGDQFTESLMSRVRPSNHRFLYDVLTTRKHDTIM